MAPWIWEQLTLAGMKVGREEVKKKGEPKLPSGLIQLKASKG